MTDVLKANYNKLLKRWNDGTEYLENKATPEQIDKWLPEYELILKQRNALCMEIWQQTGIKPTIEEFENGFTV